jgi:hypothetical protein
MPDKPSNSHSDESFEKEFAALYGVDAPEPSEELDAAIVEAAREPLPTRRSWRYPVGVGAAASALLAILLLYQTPAVRYQADQVIPPAPAVTDTLIPESSPATFGIQGPPEPSLAQAEPEAAAPEPVAIPPAEQGAMLRFAAKTDRLMDAAPAAAPSSAAAPCVPLASMTGGFERGEEDTTVSVCQRSDRLMITGPWTSAHPCAPPLWLELRGTLASITLINATVDHPARLSIADSEGVRIVHCSASGLAAVPPPP